MDKQAYAELLRIFEPLGRRACPIFGYDYKRKITYLIGTGIPVLNNQYAALITATHVLNEIPGDKVIVGGSHKLLRIPNIAVKFGYQSGGQTVDVDVSALALPAEAVKEMSDFYQFTKANELGKVEDYDKLTMYAFIGCPYSKNKSKPRWFSEQRIKPYFYVMQEFADWSAITSAGKTEVTHFALRAPLRNGVEMINAPKPQGISGCGVWKIRLDSKTGEACAPSLVGVGIEYLSRPGIFVATYIGAAAIAISQLGKCIGDGKLEGKTLYLQRNANTSAGKIG